MVPRRQHAAAAGRYARRLFLFAIAFAIACVVVRADSPNEPRVEVTESGGLYTVSASFAVSEPPETVLTVLTDYAAIPRFMPDVQFSKVLERTTTGAVLEQEAVSRFMLFSKRIHLVLDVREGVDSLRFRDRCGRSFVTYEGAWSVSQHDSLTVVDYNLSAKPSFDVPSFVLKRLLKRDAGDFIERLKAEIYSRANRRQ